MSFSLRSLPNSSPETALAALRIAAGVSLAYLHGWSKLTGALGYLLEGRE